MLKICPSCGAKNESDALMCIECMEDISAVSPVEETYLVLEGNGFSIEVQPEDVVGREGKGSEYLSAFRTVSRKHAKFHLEGNSWLVEDIGSLNGTYINGKKIEPLVKHKIEDGQEISLSKSLKLSIKIKKI
jgi:hypothetical protein